MHTIIDFKKLITFAFLIFVSVFILNLPILAQESSQSQTGQQPQTPTLGGSSPSGTGTPSGGVQPETPTEEECLTMALLANQFKKMKPIMIERPDNFKVHDFPNDAGSAFLVTWPLTPNDEASKGKPETKYVYRIYHSTGKYNVSVVKTEDPRLNHRYINLLVDFINNNAKDEESMVSTNYDIFLVSEGNEITDRLNLKALIAAINLEIDKINEGKKEISKSDEVSAFKIVYTRSGSAKQSWNDVEQLMKSISDKAGEDAISLKAKRNIRKIWWVTKMGEQIEIYKTNDEILVSDLSAENMGFMGIQDVFKDLLAGSAKDNLIPVYSTKNYHIARSIVVNPSLTFSKVTTAFENLLEGFVVGDALLIYSTDDEDLVKKIAGNKDFPFVILSEEIPKLDENNGLEITGTYFDVKPGESMLSDIKTAFWEKLKHKQIQAYKWEVPTIPIPDKAGNPRFDPEGQAETKPDFFNKHYFQLAVVQFNSEGKETGESRFGGTQMLVAQSNPFNFLRTNNVLMAVVYCVIVLWFIGRAKKGKELFIRKIAGLDAVDEAIGRATEMGRPILYLTGLDSLSTVSTIAAVNILGQVAKKVADYDSQIINPHRDPVVMSVCQEVVKEAYINAGRPDAYNADNIFYLTDDQFAYVAAIDGIMMREKPATNIFMGYYYAESLILAETGGASGAIQIAGTDSLAQLPFFITTCDYTLIGEELYAASAYLSREPLLLGSLKGQDFGKLFLMIMLILGVILVTIKPTWTFVNQIFQAQ